MNASQVHFEFQVNAECGKKRTQILQQIEIKMVDDFADKKISEFMNQGMDNVMEQDPLEGVFSHLANSNDESEGVYSSQEKLSGGRLRQMSQQVKTILNEAK